MASRTSVLKPSLNLSSLILLISSSVKPVLNLRRTLGTCDGGGSLLARLEEVPLISCICIPSSHMNSPGGLLDLKPMLWNRSLPKAYCKEFLRKLLSS
jgi:hypothetical protein